MNYAFISTKGESLWIIKIDLTSKVKINIATGSKVKINIATGSKARINRAKGNKVRINRVKDSKVKASLPKANLIFLIKVDKLHFFFNIRQSALFSCTLFFILKLTDNLATCSL